jgi:tetratricopeptide (TPR) repeat protein
MSYSWQRKYDQAIADFTQAIDLNPADPQAYFQRGFIYYLLNKWDEAISEYTKAIEHSPTYAPAYRERGDIYYKKRMRTQALADYEMYLRLAPFADDRATIEQLIRTLK